MKNRYRWIAVVLAAMLLLTATVWAESDTLIVGGNVIGLELRLDGVSIVEFSAQEPENAGLKRGDIIRKIDGKSVSTVAQIAEAVQSAQGRLQRVTVLRGSREKTVKLAAKQEQGVWRLGILVRDGISGIGTVTYYDPNDGSFGALGHGVCGGEVLLPLREGIVLESCVTDVKKGEAGSAGSLQGAVSRGAASGTLQKNTAFGIFGTMETSQTEQLPVGESAQVHLGAAVIRSTVEGADVGEYSVRITALRPDDKSGKNLSIEITDPRLLEKTGGIVQGMSGSPILQDGKLIGAVTHVLVDDPTRGFGIFIEKMLSAA